MTRKTTRKRRVTVAAQSSLLPLHIEFVLDETGSMASISAMTVAGFNDFLDDQRRVEGECRMTLSKFSDGNIRVPYRELPLSFVPEMTEQTFRANGGTNLFDAIGYRADQLHSRLQNYAVQPRVLFVVMTDGEDTMSWANNTASVKTIIERHPEWTFVYLGANQNALRIGSQMGFHEGNIKSFEGENIRTTMHDLSAATTVFRASAGATKAFF